jgi:hypothetical protein
MVELHVKTIGIEQKTRREDSPQVKRVLAGIAEAHALVKDAEEAYLRSGDRAATCQAAADRSHCNLLKAICELSEADANTVEPLFTEFENHLLRLRVRSDRSALTKA